MFSNPTDKRDWDTETERIILLLLRVIYESFIDYKCCCTALHKSFFVSNSSSGTLFLLLIATSISVLPIIDNKTLTTILKYDQQIVLTYHVYGFPYSW